METLAVRAVWQGTEVSQGQIYAYYVILNASLVPKFQPTALLAKL
jgi:hypothetical protein